MCAVFGFDADDGDDDFGRHAVLALHRLQGGGVVFPELHAAGDAGFGHEDFAVLKPGLTLGRLGHRIQNRLLDVDGFEQTAQFRFVETVLLGHLFDESVKRVGRRDFGGNRADADQRQQQNREFGFHSHVKVG